MKQRNDLHSPLFNTFRCLDLGMDADIIFNLLGSIIAHDLTTNEEKGTFINPAVSHALEKCKQAQQEYKEAKKERGRIFQDYPEAFTLESLKKDFWNGRKNEKIVFKTRIKDNYGKVEAARKNIEQSHILILISLLKENLKTKQANTASTENTENTANTENYVCSFDSVKEVARENNVLSMLLKDSPYILELFNNPLDNLAFYIHDMLVFLHYEQDIVEYSNDEEKLVVDSQILLEPLSEKQVKTMEELLQNVSHWWI